MSNCFFRPSFFHDRPELAASTWVRNSTIRSVNSFWVDISDEIRSLTSPAGAGTSPSSESWINSPCSSGIFNASISSRCRWSKLWTDCRPAENSELEGEWARLQESSWPEFLVCASVAAFLVILAFGGTPKVKIFGWYECLRVGSNAPRKQFSHSYLTLYTCYEVDTYLIGLQIANYNDELYRCQNEWQKHTLFQ